MSNQSTSTDTKAKVVFLGHSLAKHLGRYVEETCPNFGISEEQVAIKFVTRGGLKCENLLADGRLDEVRAFHPDSVIIMVGDNDLNQHSTARSVSSKIVDVLCELKHNLPTGTSITLAKIMPRDIYGTSRYHFQTYNELADEVNGHLEEELPRNFIFFKKWNFPSPCTNNVWNWRHCFSKDGVHLNDDGLRKMLLAFKKVVMSASIQKQNPVKV